MNSLLSLSVNPITSPSLALISFIVLNILLNEIPVGAITSEGILSPIKAFTPCFISPAGYASA